MSINLKPAPRAILGALFLAWLLLHATVIAAQTWPAKPVKIIMPSLPAGSPDRVTRMVADKLSVRWGQPVVIEYKPGATTVIGTELAARNAA